MLFNNGLYVQLIQSKKRILSIIGTDPEGNLIYLKITVRICIPSVYS